ncbi:MAG: hypothetical protein H7234_06910 [Herminiimonas sp.]|nr:hypothetical protein [Herminiimonas sp.]
MARIIAARFQEQEQVTQVLEAMQDAGVAQERVSSFYVNPPGQHNLYSIGGDREDSPGAHETGTGVATGVATGGAVGAAVGLTGVPVFGPVGPAVGALVGAHIGGLIGSLSQMKEKGETEASTPEAAGSDNAMHQRKAGMMLAVAVGVADPAGPDEDEIVRIMRVFGGHDIEEAEGNIVSGNWEDFDPLSAPRPLGATSALVSPAAH